MYGRPMWNLAMRNRARRRLSATATAGEGAVAGSMADGEGSRGVGRVRGLTGEGLVSLSGLENWIGAGRLRRHCSIWWCSSALTAGRGTASDSAARVSRTVTRMRLGKGTVQKT